MTTVNIHALLPKNVLTSRSSARSISDAINLELRRANGTYEINFKDIRALAPSFSMNCCLLLKTVMNRLANQ
jgi:hypothetical protein